MGTIEARLDVCMYVDCPNPECESLINLLDEDDTNGDPLDDDSVLIRHIFDHDNVYGEMECNDVVCTQCKTAFNVKGLAW